MACNKLRSKMIEVGVTAAEVAKALDINVNTAYQKISGKTDFRLGEVCILRKLLNIQTDSEFVYIFFT